MARCGWVQKKGNGTRSKRFGENVRKLVLERNRLKMEKPTKKIVTNEITVVRPNNNYYFFADTSSMSRNSGLEREGVMAANVEQVKDKIDAQMENNSR